MTEFEEWKAEKLKNPAIREAYEASKAKRDKPFHERILTDRLRDVADGIAAFLTAPLRAYDAAHDYDKEEDESNG